MKQRRAIGGDFPGTLGRIGRDRTGLDFGDDPSDEEEIPSIYEADAVETEDADIGREYRSEDEPEPFCDPGDMQEISGYEMDEAGDSWYGNSSCCSAGAQKHESFFTPRMVFSEKIIR